MLDFSKKFCPFWQPRPPKCCRGHPKSHTVGRNTRGRAPKTCEAAQLPGRAAAWPQNLTLRGRAVAEPRKTFNHIPMFAKLEAVHPKPARPRSCRDANPKPMGPRRNLNDIPLYAVPEPVHLKPAQPRSCGSTPQGGGDTPRGRTTGAGAPPAKPPQPTI